MSVFLKSSKIINEWQAEGVSIVDKCVPVITAPIILSNKLRHCLLVFV